jgi:hypothetical protein
MITTPIETVLVTRDAPKYVFVSGCRESLPVGLHLLAWVPIILCFRWQTELLSGDKFCICELQDSTLERVVCYWSKKELSSPTFEQKFDNYINTTCTINSRHRAHVNM